MTPANPDALADALADLISVFEVSEADGAVSIAPGRHLGVALLNARGALDDTHIGPLAEKISDLELSVNGLEADLQRVTAEKRSACLDALAAQDQAAENDERARAAEARAAQLQAEMDEARAENDRFRAGLANGSGPCAYCNLSREDWSKCQSGFPGCDRADDAVLCPHFGAEMEANDRADTAEAALATVNAELARLRAEGEALKGALKIADEALAPFSRCAEVGLPYSFTGADFVAAHEARTTLARAATAGEGRGDG